MIKNTSIRKRLVVSLIILTISPLLLLGAVLSWQSYTVQQRQVLALQSEASKRALSKIESIINELTEELAVVTWLDNIMKMDRSRQYNLLSKIRSHKSANHKEILNEIALIDGSGQELIRISRSSVITQEDLGNVSDSDEFRIPVTTGEVFYGPVIINKETGEPYMKISIPIFGVLGKTVEGLLVANVRLKFMWDLITDISIGSSGIAYILDRNGRVIAHPNPSVILKGTHSDIPDRPSVKKGLNGTRVVTASEKLLLGSQTFYITTELPVSEALKQTYNSLFTITLFSLFALSGAVALGFVITRKIIRPIESLADTVDAISAGDLSKKSDISSRDEIGALSDSFNIMTSRLVETIASLKNEILVREKAEKALKESHERLLLVLDSLDAIVYVADIATHEIIFVNQYTRDIFGDIEGKICWQTLQSEQSGPCIFCSNDRLLSPDGNPTGIYHWEFQNTINGKWYYIHDRAIKWADVRIVRLEIATDITERKKAEEQINLSLKEKEVLLKEIHHRVKNNMQVISSLLNLQSEHIEDKQYVDMFNESRNRIRSMALVHEKLYRSKNLARIDFNDYIKSLVNSLYTFYGTDSSEISLRLDIEDIKLPIDIAIPCGLIINEIISNSLKYAFPGGRKGEIGIALKKAVSDGNEYSLSVNDNGVGIPEDLDIKQAKSLGLQLIVNLVEHQLQGTIELDRSNGTGFTIHIEDIEYKRRI